MKLLLWLFFLLTCLQALFSLAHVHREGFQLLQDTEIKGLNASTGLHQRRFGAFYNRLHISTKRGASGGGGRAFRGQGTRILHHPRGSGHSGASSIQAFPCFSISNTTVQVGIGFLLGFMFFF